MGGMHKGKGGVVFFVLCFGCLGFFWGVFLRFGIQVAIYLTKPLEGPAKPTKRKTTEKRHFPFLEIPLAGSFGSSF
ncbi:hypothetical protein DSLASN_35640 [Desulfoluna limicola]|uniref:Uncharacterized protein n=1 Tax=Desulfoluna limicola TaxID=2810562 RepID=A0ABN6F6E3_9BACT|nr:hypothetical protein DSLASN_35640 [Desulfoluna limicola]